MRSTALISLLTLLLHVRSSNADQHAVVECKDGSQLSGMINFGKEELSIKPASGKSITYPMSEVRVVTLTPDPNHQPNPVEIARNGLRGRYYSNIKHEDTPVERIDATVSFDWGESAPAEGVRPNGFSVRWEGEIECPVSGEITFEVESDDGNRLWIDGKKLTEHWQAQTTTTHSGKIKLEANRRYTIKLEYYDAWSDAVARLRWKAEGLPREIIPAKFLFPLALNEPSEEKFHHEVHLKAGSSLSGKITKADSRRVHLETGDGLVVVPMPAVSFMKFSHSWGNDLGPMLETKPPGVALLNRDYSEGEFKGFADGVAQMESVLFGKQTIQQAELRAIKVAKRAPNSAKLMILTTSDSRILANTVETATGDRLKIRDSSGYHITVPAAQIRQIRELAFGKPEEKK